MKKILLSSSKYNENYLAALAALGAEPIPGINPPPSAEGFDGLILCGGVDIHPARYGEALDPRCGRIDEARDAAEFPLIDAFIAAGKPIFGICRGHQVLNVFFGGSLYQHIDGAERHSSEDGDLFHPITAGQGSILHSLYGKRFTVNSSHHQAVKTLGQGLKITALDDTGTVEAVEHESLPIFSVQYHPERLTPALKTEEAVLGYPLIAHFLEMCKK